MPENAPAETHRFVAEVSQVLHLVIHSLYSHKEIFLRELISNASDALDRLRFRAITEPELAAGDDPLEVRIFLDRERGTLTIEDTGVGMTKDELVKDLGTVARSGSKAFLEALAGKGQKDASLIGQFGVGFYSAYLVADRVEVVSRAAGSGEAWRWTSDATESFTVEPAERSARGTAVTLHLRDDQKEFAEPWRVRALVTRYSDYVSHPIRLAVPPAGKDAEAGAAPRLEQVNRATALWQRPRAEITEEQYDELYAHLSHASERPMAHTHLRVEGSQEFVALLFVPREPPMDRGVSFRARGVQLFVKRVLIMEHCDELVPEWLRFLRGVVDSDDLPLNVSREILQDSAAARTIRRQIVKAALDMLEALAADRPDDYRAFWGHFGATVKEGLATDFENKDRLAKLMRWESSKGEGLVSLAEYFARMPLRQEAIYYVLAESRQAAAGSPHLEELVKRGYEVLFMTDPVDEWAVSAVGEYEGKKLLSAMRAELGLEETPERKKERDDAGERLSSLRTKMKAALGDNVADVRVSPRLTESPCCLVLEGAGPHAFVDRLLRERGRELPRAKRVLEINADHPVIEALRALAADDANDARVREWALLLRDQALLTEGSSIDDPSAFARRMTALMIDASGGSLQRA